MVAGCGVPVRRDWGLKCPECHGTLSSSAQPHCGRPAHSHTSADLQTGRRWASRPRAPSSSTSRNLKLDFPVRLNAQMMCFIARQQNMSVQWCFRWMFEDRLTDILQPIKLKHTERSFCSFYLYAGLEICGRISQHIMGFDWLIFSLWLQGSVKTVNLLESPAGLQWL